MNIRTIAKMCGVSVSTVSRILNNKPDVDPETRAKVIGFMDEVGFHPSVVTNRHETIGVVTPRVFLTEFVGEIMTGIMETAFSLGKNLTLLPIDGGGLSDTLNVMHFCRSNGLSGMIVIAPPIDSKLPLALAENGVAHVVAASAYKNTKINWVDVDNAGGIREAVNYLFSCGHRRIALVNVRQDTKCLIDRMIGYQEAFQEHQLEIDPSLVVENLERGMSLENVLSHLFLMPQPPTAIICTTYRETLEILNILQRTNKRVPDDISLIGFGDYQTTSFTIPLLTTVYQQIYEIGRNAVTMLDEVMKQDVDHPFYRILPTRLIIRNSVKQVTFEN